MDSILENLITSQKASTMAFLAALQGVTTEDKNRLSNLIAETNRFITALSNQPAQLPDPQDVEAYMQHIDAIFENLQYTHRAVSDNWPPDMKVRKYFDDGGKLKFQTSGVISKYNCIQGFKTLREKYPDDMDGFTGETWDSETAKKYFECVIKSR